MNVKILKEIIIAFLIFFSFSRYFRHPQKGESFRGAERKTKEVIPRYFNWTFISVLENDFHFSLLSPPKKKHHTKMSQQS